MRNGGDRRAGAVHVESYVPTALVVDDDRSWLSWLEFHLSKAGWQTVCIDCAAAALAIFAEHEPDVVLLDQQMPDSTGTQIAAHLRALGFCGPMMLLSAATDMETRNRCSELSVECVSKLAQSSLFGVMAAWRAEIVARHPVQVIDLTDGGPDSGGRLRRLLRLGRQN